MKKIGFYASLLLILAAFAALVSAPAEAAEGARRGLSVCGGVILPALLPFLILSGLLTALGLPRLLGRRLAPIMGKLFRVPGAAAAPFFLGLTGGYPVGAAATAELVRRGELRPREAGRVLAFCNNTGPAFIIGAAGSGVFGSARLGLLLYASHILAAAGVGLLFSLGKPRPRLEAAGEAPFSYGSPVRELPGCVARGVTAALNICGFVVFFSVVTALLEALGLFSSAVGALAAGLGLELRFCRALLTGLLELGGGIGAMAGLAPTPGNLALASFLLGFGSLSVHCQTLAVIDGAEIPAGPHFLGRLLHGLLSAGLTALLASI